MTVHTYQDLDGNQMTAAWNPRGCLKGYTVHRPLPRGQIGGVHAAHPGPLRDRQGLHGGGHPGQKICHATYPRIPGWEQLNDSVPFYNNTGRIEFYRDEDELINYGENLIVHREPVEATPFLPNIIVGSHAAIWPMNDIPLEAQSADERQVRNIKMPWREVKQTKNFLIEQGYRFYGLTPKTPHRVHSSWVVDWHII